MVLAAQPKPITSTNPMPGAPSLFIPVQMDWSPRVIKSVHPVGKVLPKTSKDKAGSSTIAPLANITKSQGAQIPENSETALKPYNAIKTTKIPTAKTIKINQKLVGYQLSCAGTSKAKRTAVDDTVIIAAEITEKMITFAQLYILVIESPAILFRYV